MEINKDLIKLHEAYKKHTGNLQQEAAGSLVLAHILMQVDESLKDLQETVQESNKILDLVAIELKDFKNVVFDR